MKRFTLILSLFLLLGSTRAAWDEGQLGDPFLREFTVYPNPTQGELTISLSAFDASAKLSLKVYSIIGQEMYATEIGPFSGTQKISLDFDKFPKGVYMIEVSSGTQVKTKRVTLI